MNEVRRSRPVTTQSQSKKTSAAVDPTESNSIEESASIPKEGSGNTGSESDGEPLGSLATTLEMGLSTTAESAGAQKISTATSAAGVPARTSDKTLAAITDSIAISKRTGEVMTSERTKAGTPTGASVPVLCRLVTSEAPRKSSLDSTTTSIASLHQQEQTLLNQRKSPPSQISSDRKKWVHSKQKNTAQKRKPLSPSSSKMMDEGPGPKKKRKILLCQIIGCPRQVSSKGYCKPHLEKPDLIVTKPIRDEDAKYERYTGPGKRGPKVKTNKKGYEKKRPDPFPIFFPKLVQYKKDHGNLRVPRSEKELFNFAESCRNKYSLVQEGKTSRILSPERIEQLDSIGFEWIRVIDDDWEEHFRMLVDYRNEHGHCRVNTRTDGSLSNFVKKTRTNYSQQMAAKEKGTLTPDRTRTLTPDRIQRLNAMGFEWRVWTQDPWEKRFHEIQDFQNEHGHFNVKFGENQTLSSWVKTQRTGYRNFMAALRADNDRKMAARRDPNGDAPFGMDEAYEKLSKKRPMIDADRIIKLQMIGFEWNVQENHNETAWEKHFMQLIEFKAEYGHTRVSRNYQENLQLGTWVKMQRRAMTKKIKGQGGDSLSEERIRRLNDIGFEWRLKPLEMDEHELPAT